MDNLNKEDRKKRNLKLVEKYDDYLEDFSNEPFQIGEADFEQSSHLNKQDINVREEGNWHHPGVSGKSDEKGTWINEREYKKQTSFVGYGPKGYHRSDDRIYEEVCEALTRHHEVDASHIGVRVDNGIVYLSGKVDSRRSKKMAENIIEDLPGVQDIRNELIIIKGDNLKKGPEASIKKDLGI